VKIVTIISAALLLTGCGTVNSIARNDVSIAHSLKNAGTRCTAMPRIYGGVAYDFCKLHSDPKSGYYNWFLGFYIIDIVPSLMADTVLLPFSAYSQAKNGPVDL
jgi:uncharacterized protein YceK